MDLSVTLYEIEADALLRKFPGGTLEEALHAALAPMIEKEAEARLQSLASQYRQLPPDLQFEVFRLIQGWKVSKDKELEEKQPPVEVTPVEVVNPPKGKV